jgi:3-oxoacyl-[acyl-carrier protein] reductase
VANLENKVVIVTGGARGIGQAFCEKLAKDGAAILCADVLDGAETVDLVTKAGGRGLYVKTDITDVASTKNMAAEAVKAYGRIDGLVNNAAVYAGLKMCPFTDINEAEWDKVYNVNVKGNWQCCKAVFPYMKEAGGGSIINISSTSILQGVPLLFHYVGSKGAVWAMTRTLANEAGVYNIRVNSITPGYTLTDASMQLSDNPEDFNKNYERNINDRALKRGMMPADLVGAAAFLLSDESSFITGQNLNVDGGSVHY